jgi:6-phosphogluconolactonase/glucosamine-6-phosphate isomerase/deaminase
VKFINDNSPGAVVGYLAGLINKKLADGQKVLWLVAGGSAIKVAAAVSKQLQAPANGLTIALSDERYGPVGHADSNWLQLNDSGFAVKGATMLPVLCGKSLAQTAIDYNNMLNTHLKSDDYSLALAGIGPDGHIFGIKPGSPSVNSKEGVVAYEWDDYVRITPTLNIIKELDEVVVYAMGEEKWPQLEALSEELDTKQQPAQLLKQLKKVIIFNDYKGDKL